MKNKNLLLSAVFWQIAALKTYKLQLIANHNFFVKAKFIFTTLFVLLFSVNTWAQISIVAHNTDYTTSWDGWNGTAPSGFTASNTYRGASASTTGGTYAISGSGFGWQASSNATSVSVVGTYQNTTGAPITSITITYDAFQIVSRASRTPGWTVTSSLGTVTSLNWTFDGTRTVSSPAQPTVTLTGLSIANNTTFTVTWTSDRGAGSGSSPLIGLRNIKVRSNGSSGPPTQAANPIFSILSGNYLTTQSVEIESPDTGDIYYTTDNFTTTTPYTGAITVSSTTTIKAFVEKTGLTNSDTVTSTYSFPVNVATIRELRAQAADNNTIYRLTGEAVLTFKSAGTGNFNQKYIQDTSGGVLIHDNPEMLPSSFNIGDGIDSLTGKLMPYNSLLEFVLVATPGAASSTNNTVTTKEITIAELNSGNYDGQLVKINNVTITGSGTFAQSTDYVINDGTASGTLRPHYANSTVVNYIGTAIPTTVRNITGVVYNNAAGAVTKLVPRFLADFETPFACAAPTGIDTTNVGNTGFTLFWNKVSDTASYEYAVQTSSIPPASGIATTDTFTTFSTLNTATKYYVFVRTQCDISTFSDWSTIDSVTTLPVKYISFDGKASGNNVQLSWRTAQEVNNSHFEVQRSLNGKTFVAIGTVKGHGTYNALLNYAFTDENALTANAAYYYRLKQVDFDGKYEYSKTVFVEQKEVKTINQVSVNPNPVTDRSNVQYALQTVGNVNITIYNIVGQPVMVLVNKVQEKGQYNLALPQLTKGIYFVQVNAGNTSKTIRVVAE